VATGRFEQLPLERFEDCYESPGGEVWVRAEDALAALELAKVEGFRLLGFEGFIVGPEGVFPAMSRIADFPSGATTWPLAAEMLRGPWSERPTDVHPQAAGRYMIDVCVSEER
jgi:hypothetical protein